MDMFIPRVHHCELRIRWESHLKTLTLLRNFMDFSKYMGAGSQGGLILKNYPANRKCSAGFPRDAVCLVCRRNRNDSDTNLASSFGTGNWCHNVQLFPLRFLWLLVFLTVPGAGDSKMTWHAFGHSLKGWIHRSALASGCGQVRLFQSFGQQFPAVTDAAVKRAVAAEQTVIPPFLSRLGHNNSVKILDSWNRDELSVYAMLLTL